MRSIISLFLLSTLALSACGSAEEEAAYFETGIDAGGVAIEAKLKMTEMDYVNATAEINCISQNYPDLSKDIQNAKAEEVLKAKDYTRDDYTAYRIFLDSQTPEKFRTDRMIIGAMVDFCPQK